MANVRNSNTWYIDTAASSLAIANLKVSYVIVTATAAAAILNLQDVTTTANKANLRVATSGDSVVFDFSLKPLVFPNGILPSTVTNCVATCVLEETRGG